LITIPLTTEDLTKVRIAPSPLWETVCSFGVLVRPDRHAVHAPWASRTRAMLRGIDLSPLFAAMGVGGCCPDYLSPPPETPLATFSDELERLRATPPEVVQSEVSVLAQEQSGLLSRLPREKERMLRVQDDPEGSLKKLVDALDRYHELAISPYWLRVREHLEGDMLRRGRALALGGAEMLLSGLDPRLGYRGGTLELDGPNDTVVETGGRGLTLVPCVFSWPGVFVLADPHFRPTLAYAPRGVARLWSSSPPRPDGTALGAALGEGRASVLKGLLVPRTTTELAGDLDRSPAAVSAHLSRLKAAGLVEPHRNGRRVFYRLSGAGEALLEVFAETA
jgi:hypothetical protein